MSQEPGFWSQKQLEAMDYAFSNALAKAINRGKEHTPIGVVTAPGTDRPTVVLAFSRNRSSYGNSAAACCADIGEPFVEDLPWRQRKARKKTHANHR